MIALPLIYILVFAYYPMVGAQIAFRKFNMRGGVWNSEWVGLANFRQFFASQAFWKVLTNTLQISFYGLIAGFPFPILLAVCLNYTMNKTFKKTLQMISYAPNFISTVVMCGIILQFLNTRTGIVNVGLQALGLEPFDFMASAPAFSSVYVWSGIWQYVGFNSIIYIAALAGINPELHEAAIIDGATKIKRIIHIDIPGILPTTVVLLILNAGQILNIGFEKVLLLQTPLNLRSSEVIATYVYKVGLTSNFPNYSLATAIGLFQSVIGLALLTLVNQISGELSETSLW
jgi:ABC-type polysaccharide transport system permease subunit